MVLAIHIVCNTRSYRFLNANWPRFGTAGCGMNSVNLFSDSFGHGVSTAYSIVVGHEYAEAVTDPDNSRRSGRMDDIQARTATSAPGQLWQRS